MAGLWGNQTSAADILIDIFSIYSPTVWINNQTPTVIGSFSIPGPGVNCSTVEYAYSDDGNLTPTNWISVNGTYSDDLCTLTASNGSITTVYAEAIGVPFNLDSATANTIRFQVSDQAGNVYTEINAQIIKIDSVAPQPFYAFFSFAWIMG